MFPPGDRDRRVRVHRVLVAERGAERRPDWCRPSARRAGSHPRRRTRRRTASCHVATRRNRTTCCCRRSGAATGPGRSCAVFETSVVASDVAVCVALLGPEDTFPPAIETGTFAFTAFWSLFAIPIAAWLVSAFWTPSWKPPGPPQPARHEPPPMFWLRCWSWSVLALFETSVVAFDVAFCVALLGPEETFPPAIETGTFAFTAFWSLFATPTASWLVWASWIPAWNPPAPPQPSDAGPAADVLAEALVLVGLGLVRDVGVAEELAVCVAELGPEFTLPPAIETGTLAFTAFWSLLEHPRPAGWSGRSGLRPGIHPRHHSRRNSRSRRCSGSSRWF